MYVCLSVCLSVPSYLRQFRMYGADFFRRARGSTGGCPCIKQFPRGRDVTKEPTFDVEYVTQYSS